MKNKLKLILLMLMPVLMVGSFFVSNVVAIEQNDYVLVAAKEEEKDKAEDKDTNSVETNLFGTVTDDGSGCGVYTVLNLVLTILTYGVGIAATVGLVLSSIMYLTAGADTGKTAKAKTRIFEIVIGLLLYAMMWAALNWLMPGGVLNNGNTC